MHGFGCHLGYGAVAAKITANVWQILQLSTLLTPQLHNHQILTKKICLQKGNDIEITFISTKQDECKATTIVVNSLKLHTNPKILVHEFVWSFEVLITNVLDIIYYVYFDYIISMSVPFKRHLFCQNQC